MKDAADRLAARFGPAARDWVARAPAVAAQLASRWGFRLAEEIEGGASSVVWRCRWPDGTPAVLKLSPDRALLTEQAGMLRLFGPSGRVPAVLATDSEAGAMVLEEILPGTEAVCLPPGPLPEQWAGLLAALHAVPPPPRLARDLRGRCDESFSRIGRRLSEPLISRHIGQPAWQRAIGRCRRLLDTQTRPVLLHGDLHLGNARRRRPRPGGHRPQGVPRRSVLRRR